MTRPIDHGQIHYLDHAATTPMLACVREAITPWTQDSFGNPSGAHGQARKARVAIEDARDEIAAHFGVDAGCVVFTGGGTESDNMAIAGVCGFDARGNRRGNVLYSAIEHPAVAKPSEFYGGTVIPVTNDGEVDIEAFQALLGDVLTSSDDAPILVSLMLVNNETGIVQPLHHVARVIEHSAPRALLHTDAVQALSWLDIQRYISRADFVSVSAHKIGGPQGVGALVVRPQAKSSLQPVVRGGEQERDLRSGTHNVAGIVGFGAAVKELSATRGSEVKRVQKLRERLVSSVVKTISGVSVTGENCECVPGIAHFTFDGVNNEELLILLDESGVCASGGSSCASGALEPSHVLTAMGYSRQRARSGLRLSMGKTTSDADIDTVMKVLPEIVERLRR